MRQIATLANEEAKRFADYLLTLKIETKLDSEVGGVAVWICDEDKVPEARSELDRFRQNPGDERYTQASPVARQLRRKEIEVEEDYSRRQKSFAQEMTLGRAARGRPLTIVLFVISVFATLATNFGGERESPVMQAFSIASYKVEGDFISWRWLQDVTDGEVWRLVTPIFLHFGVVHLLFNMIMLFSLGSRIEQTRGTLRLLVLVLVIAVGSNVAEYYMTWSMDRRLYPVFQPSPLFGGMSGVLYGLFGYMWMKSRFEPELGLEMPRETVLIMLVWLLVCLWGFLGPIANIAHISGLLLGQLIGSAPLLWRRRR